MTGRVATLLTTLGGRDRRAVHDRGETGRHVIIWNASESVPIGLYRLRPTGRLARHRTCRGPAARTTRNIPRRWPLSAARHSHAEARAGASRADGLPRPSHHHGRQDLGGRGARARQPRPPAARLAGLSRHRRRRSLPHELAVGGLARWAIFRGAADERDHRKGGASLDRRGGMTLPQNCKPSVIPLFGQNTDHSSVPAKVRTAVARSGGQGRPSGRRVSASPLTAASTMAALRSLGTMLCIVMILAASMLSSSAAHAGQVSSATHRASGKSFHPFAAFVTEASRRFAVPEHWIRAVMHVESGAKSARAVIQRAPWA